MDERLLCLFGSVLLNAMIETGNFLYIGMHGALDRSLYARHNRIMRAMYEDFVNEFEAMYKEKHGEDAVLFPCEDVPDGNDASKDPEQDSAKADESAGKAEAQEPRHKTAAEISRDLVEKAKKINADAEKAMQSAKRLRSVAKTLDGVKERQTDDDKIRVAKKRILKSKLARMRKF